MASSAKMSSVKSITLPVLATRTSVPMRLSPSQRRVVCKSQTDNLKTAAVVATPALLTATPAFARVADTMNSEGTGLAFGITDNVLGWAMLITFGLVWALYATSAKSLGGGETDDSGMSL